MMIRLEWIDMNPCAYHTSVCHLMHLPVYTRTHTHTHTHTHMPAPIHLRLPHHAAAGRQRHTRTQASRSACAEHTAVERCEEVW